MNHRFKIGDHVRVIGILADFYPGKIGTVVAVRPHETGITELDHYVIEIPDVEMGDTAFRDFQLSPYLDAECARQRQPIENGGGRKSMELCA